MTSSHASSKTSAPCRIELDTSRRQAYTIAAIGGLAAVAPWLSGMPGWLAIILTLVASACTAGLVSAELRRGRRGLILTPDGRAVLDGESLSDLHVVWRGRVPFLRWVTSSGVRGAWIGTSDVLSHDARRRLRLARAGDPSAPGRRSVAP